MSGGFTDLGLPDHLAANAGSVGYDTPTELQRMAIPVLRRGNNAIITATSGAGATAAYALALLDRFGDATTPRALVLSPTAERAHQIARTIGQLGSGTTARVASLGEGWRNPASAAILVATPARVQQAMGASELSFDTIEAIVVDNADTIQSLGEIASLNELFTALPREGQRIFVGGSFSGELEKLVESHARKALHFPPRPAIGEEPRSTTPSVIGTVRYAVAHNGAKLELLARMAADQREEVRVLARSRRGVEEVEHELKMRGVDAEVTTFNEALDNYGGRTYAYDVPGTPDQIGYLQDSDVIICTPAEIAHVRRIADAANVDIAAIRDRSKGDEGLETFRNEIRDAARSEDLSAQLLILQPLFDEFSPAEVAGALSALLRSRRPQKSDKQPAAGGKHKTWSRLFISIGERDGVTARDVVGAITGEAGVTGGDVGKVEVRDTFSVIEVASTAADQVIKAMNGTTMKGRALRVDYDRKSGTGGGERQPRSSGDRPRGRDSGPRSDRDRGDRPPPRRPRTGGGTGGGRGGGTGGRGGRPPRSGGGGDRTPRR